MADADATPDRVPLSDEDYRRAASDMPEKLHAPRNLRDQILRTVNAALARGDYDAADFIVRAFFGEGTVYSKATRS